MGCSRRCVWEWRIGLMSKQLRLLGMNEKYLTSVLFEMCSTGGGRYGKRRNGVFHGAEWSSHSV